ncbi:GDSL esterase/lipase At5g41890-like [Hibiscus syriacus]|uniref:GDSL esterase/lipase At5g41890-like n=1 Tax=Hibiscus syriacus TaxID=106335 RepID=UPI0019237633|nr:GDSL esterase/lipase At5g41890-like [Hibiscus syriacus]
MGARKLIVVGVGPLGCIPFVRAFNLLPSGKCSRRVNALIQAYNHRLKLLLNRLNQEMGPDAIFVFANSYDVFMDILANYRRFGFENEDEPCCGGYFPPFVCFQRGDANATASALCDYRSKYVFWDAYHPTEDANLIIAKQLVDGDESVSFPFNIRQLYNCN